MALIGVERRGGEVAGADAFDDAEPLTSADLRALGTTLVVAPHPDDEAIGCGGLIARLGEAGQAVWIVAVSDGTGSHPNSVRFDAAARRTLREAELRASAACLGVAPERVTFLRLPDGELPGPGDAGFDAAVDRLHGCLVTSGAASVVAPWRRDPHPDHRAAHAMTVRALAALPPPCRRLLEYQVWAAERGAPNDAPRPGEARAWRLDLGPAVAAKRRAVDAHRSQHGEVITDDPGGFTIPASMRARAGQPFEHFLEAP